MAIVFGTQSFGHVDRIPGLGYVATHFFHINYLPLAPTQSFFVLEGTESGNEFRGKPLPMSGKSVMAGYLRGWGVFACAITAGFSWFSLGHAGGGENWMGVVSLIVGLGLVGVAFWLWNRGWLVAQGLFHLGSIGGWAAVAMMGRADGVLNVFTLLANVFMAGHALTRLIDNAGHSRAVELMEEMGYDRETAEEILVERKPGRRTANREDD